MATRAYTVFLPMDQNGCTIPNAIGVRWTGILNGDDGTPFVCGHRSVKSVQVYGTLGAGGNLRVEGTNDPVYDSAGTLQAVNYATLSDQSANELDLTAAGIKTVQQNVNAIRPRATAGDGTTSLTVVAILGSPDL